MALDRTICLSIVLNVLLTTAFADICMDSVCEFELVIRQRRSMTYTAPSGVTYNVALNSTENRLQIIENAFHKQAEHSIIGDFVDADDVITTDGLTRNIYVINDQFPGPTLEVMEGSQVRVKVINKLGTEGVTIHFHGQHFMNNAWMDGAGYISQCPILPGQSFEYRFKPYPVGTFWYHSHFRNTRIDGVFGAFIVHRQVSQIPYDVITVQDWFHEDATTLRIMGPYDPEYRGTGEAALHYLDQDYAVDGNELSILAYDSTLIGGRGRRNFDDELLPLATYDVTFGARHRFHLIHTGAEYYYEVMVDSHPLMIVALDGHTIRATSVDSFIISPSERVNFEIQTNQPIGQYWIRAEIIRQGKGLPVEADGIIKGGKAILKYGGSDDTNDPTSTRRECTAGDPCVTFNCPFLGYRADQYKTCVTLNDVQSSFTTEYLDHEYGIQDGDVEEYMLNWGYHIGPSVNGRKFAVPTAPFSGENDANMIHCDEAACESGCYCTNILNIPFNKTIQLVLSNLQFNSAFLGHHAMHIHGHSFAVMKVGFPDYNQTSGLWQRANNDIVCDSDLCAHASWNGPRVALNDVDPVVKDTVVVPARGYVVIRFKSNNPGYWPLHCHQEMHFEEGMGMLINEGEGHHPPVPNHFPTCGDYIWSGSPSGSATTTEPSDGEDNGNEHNHNGDNDDDDDEDDNDGDYVRIRIDRLIGTAIGFTLIGAILTAVPMLLLACCLHSRNTHKT